MIRLSDSHTVVVVAVMAAVDVDGRHHFQFHHHPKYPNSVLKGAAGLREHSGGFA
jgi:hypothetical protein